MGGSGGLGGVVPSTTADVNLIISNNTNAANADVPNYLYMPPTLQQATGSATWTINDVNGGVMPYISAFSLVNQGAIFVNNTANFVPGSSANVNWVLTGQTGYAGGSQYFENDGAVDIIGSSGSGTTTADITGNLYVTGSGQFNLYGDNA